MQRRRLAIFFALLSSAIVAFILNRIGWPVWVWVTSAVATGAFAYWTGTYRQRRRERVAAAPLAQEYKDALSHYVAFYRALSQEEKRRFESEVAIFLDEQVVTGPRGSEIDAELKALTAASAVALVFGRRGYHYPRLRDVVVYAEAFDDDYRVDARGHVLGMVHAQGPILLSARALKSGFLGARDGRNVGYHEFAHVLDFETGQADGVPSFMPWGSVAPWLGVVHRETTKIGRGRSLLRRYATTNGAEFFAVATEAFFEQPDALRARHPELYEFLKETYGQEPPRDR